MFAEPERSIVIGREGDGIARTRAGRKIGRPAREVDLEELRRLRAQGLSIRQIGRRMSIPTSTIAKRLKLITRSVRPETVLQETGDGA